MNQVISFFRHKILLPVLCIGIATCATGQSYIDEDFLDNLEANARFMLSEPAPAFAENKVPAKWQDASAVIIGFSRNVLFDRQSSGGFFTRRERNLYFFEKIHFKIKLNDNNAVQAFSQIYFRYGMKQDGFIARIIKTDGAVHNVDLKSAVGSGPETPIPAYFQSFFDRLARSEYEYYKVPVSNLEPGDILEYVATTRSKLEVRASYLEFSPIYEVCSKEYPVMYNEIAIETDDKSFFKSLSLNGAPKFVKQNTADREFFRYVLIDKDRDTEKDVNFVSPLLQFPVVKFQVIYSNNDQVKGALIGEKGELKSEFSREELALRAWEDYEKVGSEYISAMATIQGFVNNCWSELVKLGAKNWPEQQYIDQTYYLLRNKILFRNQYLSDKRFAYIYGSLLYQRNIKSDLIITIGNNTGRLNEILFDEEIRYAIKVGDKLYFNATDFSNPGELMESLLDNEAYIIYEPAKKSRQQEIKPFTLPGTVAADNSSEFTIVSELSADMKNLMVIRTSSYKGLQKQRVIAEALKFTPYMFDDYKNYGGNDPVTEMKGKEAQDYNNTLRTLKEEWKDRKIEAVKESLETEFHQRVSNVHFSVLSDGRSPEKNTLTFKEGFESTDFVRKAGKKYLINLAGLIGSQLQIKKEERNRKFDIDVRYPRSYTWNISFKIPEGYTAEGLTELNKTVDNESGMFSISAKEENGSVLITARKAYKAKNISKAKWNDMLAFLDAAYNNTFKYILLKPKK